MGIHGIYKEIGPGVRIALSKLAVEKFEKTGRPLRIAIDTSIWLFQIQSSKGGTNPALRTFYYRLLRLLSLSIHPLFIFDGPNKPPFKRNKRTRPNVASIPEYLAKQLLKQFGFPFHIAPGEAEAECALLQREGIVDAVLSEDVDTLMFGSIISLRSWTPEGKSKVATHVNLYDAKTTKAGPAGLDREGMILVALMSGGDYLPEGVPGCGPKTACEAARAGFGRRLCKIAKRDTVAIKVWKEDLAHELHTNESKFFKRKHSALTIPDDFPRMDILQYYTNPAISSPDALERLRSNLRWDQDLSFPELRTFTGDVFDWTKLGGAKKFVRNLAPALLVRQLRMRGQRDPSKTSITAEETQAEEARLVTSIHGKREHPSTDNTPELRIAFKPIDIVSIDLEAEEPDDEIATETDAEDEEVGPGDDDAPKKRGPSTYDPTQVEKIWILESYVKVGVPLKVEDWEEAQRNKVAGKRAPASKATKSKKTAPKSTASGGMQFGALDRFARVTKAGNAVLQTATKEVSTSAERPSRPVNLDAPDPQPDFASTNRATSISSSRVPRDRSTRQRTPLSDFPQLECIDLSESPPVSDLEKSKITRDASDEHYQPPNVTKRRKNFRRTHTMPADLTNDLPTESASDSRTCFHATDAGDLLRPSPLPEESAISTMQHRRDKKQATQSTAINPRASTPPPRRNGRQATRETEILSPPRRQMTLLESFERGKSLTPKKPRYKSTLDIPPGIEQFDLTSSSPPRSGSPPAADPVTYKSLDLGTGTPDATHRVRNRATDSSKPISAQRDVLGDKSGNFLTQTRPQKASYSAKAPDSSVLSSFKVSKTVLSDETIVPARRSPRQRKQAVKLRESLEGSWKFVNVEEVDMTRDINVGSGGSKANAALALKNRKISAWRTSEVDMLDLTNE